MVLGLFYYVSPNNGEGKHLSSRYKIFNKQPRLLPTSGPRFQMSNFMADVMSPSVPDRSNIWHHCGHCGRQTKIGTDGILTSSRCRRQRARETNKPSRPLRVFIEQTDRLNNPPPRWIVCVYIKQTSVTFPLNQTVVNLNL